MTNDLLIIGGGQGRECLDIALAMIEDGADLNVVGFIDDDPSPHNRDRVENRGFPSIGTFRDFLEGQSSAEVCIGVGSLEVRRKFGERLAQAGRSSPRLIHPASSLGSGVVLGPGLHNLARSFA